MMDPLWSETCWSTFKYFIIVTVSTYYILCISWVIKCLITLALHFSTRKSWSCRCSIFQIKTHSTSYFSGRTIQHFEEAADILFWGQKKSCRYFIFGQKTPSIFYWFSAITSSRYFEEAVDILFFAHVFPEFFFTELKSDSFVFF